VSDQATNVFRDQFAGLNQQARQQGVMWAGPRPSVVWVAYRDYGCEGKSEPIAVFPTKALADIFIAGADAAQTTSVKVVEIPITWAS
jgi:hypothetical protein